MSHTSCHLLLPLVVLAVVRCSVSQVFFAGPCPKILPMRNFDPKRFLGRWYEIERFFVSYEGLAGTCWVENYLYDPHRGHYTRLDWKDRLTGTVRTIENAITFDKKEPGRLRYVLARPSIPWEYLILATDYASFALAWQCQQDPIRLGHTEILWLLSKQQYPKAYVIRNARNMAKALGLRVEHLRRQNRSRCPP